MRELTIGEKLFIDGSYKELKPREMAAALRISNELVRWYMHSMDYESVCRRTPAKPLTERDKEHIRNNSAVTTINQLSVQVNKSFNTVKRFILQEKLPHELSGTGRPKGIIKLFNHQPEPEVKKVLVRPPAQYSNPDWRKYGEEILNR